MANEDIEFYVIMIALYNIMFVSLNIFNYINLIIPIAHKMVKHSLKILEKILQDI